MCPGQAPAPVPSSSRAEALAPHRLPGAHVFRRRWLGTGQSSNGPKMRPKADGLRPSPASSGQIHSAADHTHLVREAPEVSHVPADVTSPSQPLRPLASSTCEKPQAARSTAARGTRPVASLHPQPLVPRPGPLTRPQGVPGLPNIQARPAGSAHLRAAPSRTPGPLRSPHGGSHRNSVSRNAQASQPVRWRQRL